MFKVCQQYFDDIRLAEQYVKLLLKLTKKRYLIERI
jgi:hypothetical protein